MIQKGQIKLDEKILKEEDRRFLISDVTQRYSTNEQMKLSNKSLFIAIIVLFVSLITMVFSLNFILNIYKIFFIFVIILMIIIFITIFYRSLKKSNKKIDEQIGGLDSTYSNLFAHHFRYAIKN